MLLQRLAEYADRAGKDLPPPFYRVRTVRWGILLQSGRPEICELAELSGADQPAGQPMPVPHISRSGVRPAAMLLADDLRYVTGFPANDSERARDDSDRRNEDYIALLTRWRDSVPDDPVAATVVSFFERGFHKRLAPQLKTAKHTDIAAIMVDGEWAHERRSAVGFWGDVARQRKASANAGLCLVCGKPGSLLDTIPEMVKAGAIPAGSGRSRDAQLISVNKPAQGRGGKIQLASAPVCDRCGSAAMTALNALLADRSSRYRTEDSVLTWWLREERDLPWMDWLNDPKPSQVRKLIDELHKPHRGTGPGSIDLTVFCAVTLSVNQSRIVVRDWLEVPLEEVQKSLGQWFADHQVTDLWKDGLHAVPLWLIADCTGRWGARDGQERYLSAAMPHGCKRDLLLTALQRERRPPAYLLAHLLQRIRADRRIDLPRAALLRLILVRSADPADPPEENYMTGLAPDLPSPPYQCGRMFAVLEQIQRAALGQEVNTTIADKYLSAATATPLAILTMLRKNANGHLKRLRRSSVGAYYALNTRLDEVLEHLDAASGIPATLDLAGQAKFILGYHHQRAADLAAARARGEKQMIVGTTDPGEAE
jgi:CRISPR-associated protein Csd1